MQLRKTILDQIRVVKTAVGAEKLGEAEKVNGGNT